MYIFKPTSRFKRQYKKLNQNDKQSAKAIINKLLSDEPLEPKHKDHKLTGQYEGFRECHIKPDLLLGHCFTHNLNPCALDTSLRSV